MAETCGGVAVVGGSVAGVAAADAVRAAGYRGGVHLFESQPHVPYDRPPMSKKLLAGDAPEAGARVALRKDGHFTARGIDLHLGSRVTALDAVRRSLTLAGGATCAFDAVVLAPGADVRPMPFPVDDGAAHVLRGWDDAVGLSRALRAAGSLIVIGAGFIGLEIATMATDRGIATTVVDATQNPLAEALGPPAARVVLDRHRHRGTRLALGVGVAAVRRTGSRTSVELTTGEVLVADLVTIGVGVRPSIEWLEGSGLALGDGIVLDEHLASDVPAVYGCGDAASWVNPVYGRRMRVEHWTTAREQGARAGLHAARAAMASQDDHTAFAHVPYVWSDQVCGKIQFVGHRVPGSETVVERDDGHAHISSHYYAGRLVGRTTINAPKDVMAARRQILADFEAMGPIPAAQPAPAAPRATEEALQ